MGKQKTNEKARIGFTRTYRHFRVNKAEQLLYFLVLIVPSIVLFLLFYTEITQALAQLAHGVLSKVFGDSVGVSSGEFIPWFGGVSFVTLPTRMPSGLEILINFAVSLVLMAVALYTNVRKKHGTPVSIYFSIILLIHLIACVYFLFAAQDYPYTATEYSELYIKQQVAIWLSFILLSGLFLDVIGYGKAVTKILFFVMLMAYSFVFGVVRYITFMYLITSVSMLYMPTLFFSLGPLYDFLYLVFFYALYIHVKAKYYDAGEGRLDWSWL